MGKVRRNWAELTVEFAASDMSLTDFAMAKKIPYDTIYKQSKKLNWSKKRQLNGEAMAKKSLEMVADTRAQQLAEQNQRDISAAKQIVDAILIKLSSSDLKPADIRALSGSLKDAQAVARLALGASTDNQDLNVVSDFESWLNERINIEN